jgi:hypothetical protein
VSEASQRFYNRWRFFVEVGNACPGATAELHAGGDAAVWCKNHHLNDDWAVELAARSVEICRAAHARGTRMYFADGFVEPDIEPRHAETAAARRAARTAARRAEAEFLNEPIVDGHDRKGHPQHVVSPDRLRWLARSRVGGESTDRIAEDEGLSIEAIRIGIGQATDRLGLTRRPRGRPRRTQKPTF